MIMLYITLNVLKINVSKKDTVSIMLFFTIFHSCFGSFISSSSLQSCLASGNSTLNCSQELIVTLSIQNGQNSHTESLEATLTSITSNNASQQLLYPLKITVEKSSVKARYPLNYIQDFNNKAEELLIASDIFNCQDGANSNSPTCG